MTQPFGHLYRAAMAWAPPPELEGEPLRKQVPIAFMMPSNGINFIPEEYVDITDVWPTKLQMVLSHSRSIAGINFDAVELQEPLEQYFVLPPRPCDQRNFTGCSAGGSTPKLFRWWKASDG